MSLRKSSEESFQKDWQNFKETWGQLQEERLRLLEGRMSALQSEISASHTKKSGKADNKSYSLSGLKHAASLLSKSEEEKEQIYNEKCLKLYHLTKIFYAIKAVNKALDETKNGQNLRPLKDKLDDLNEILIFATEVKQVDKQELKPDVPYKTVTVKVDGSEKSKTYYVQYLSIDQDGASKPNSSRAIVHVMRDRFDTLKENFDGLYLRSSPPAQTASTSISSAAQALSSSSSSILRSTLASQTPAAFSPSNPAPKEKEEEKKKSSAKKKTDNSVVGGSLATSLHRGHDAIIYKQIFFKRRELIRTSLDKAQTILKELQLIEQKMSSSVIPEQSTLTNQQASDLISWISRMHELFLECKAINSRQNNLALYKEGEGVSKNDETKESPELLQMKIEVQKVFVDYNAKLEDLKTRSSHLKYPCHLAGWDKNAPDLTIKCKEMLQVGEYKLALPTSPSSPSASASSTASRSHRRQGSG